MGECCLVSNYHSKQIIVFVYVFEWDCVECMCQICVYRYVRRVCVYAVCVLIACICVPCVCSRRPVYVSAVRPQSKHIVVIIDHGVTITDTQLQIARDAALVVLSSVDEHDKVRSTLLI